MPSHDLRLFQASLDSAPCLATQWFWNPGPGRAYSPRSEPPSFWWWTQHPSPQSRNTLPPLVRFSRPLRDHPQEPVIASLSSSSLLGTPNVSIFLYLIGTSSSRPHDLLSIIPLLICIFLLVPLDLCCLSTTLLQLSLFWSDLRGRTASLCVHSCQTKAQTWVDWYLLKSTLINHKWPLNTNLKSYSLPGSLALLALEWLAHKHLKPLNLHLPISLLPTDFHAYFPGHTKAWDGNSFNTPVLSKPTNPPLHHHFLLPLLTS